MSSEKLSFPLLGDPFPELEVKTTEGALKLPAHFKGKWFVLFSHPADFTPVCTTEFVAFAIRAQKFDELGCGLIGLSVDQVFSHIKWIEWIEENIKVDGKGVNVPYPVIADDGKVSRALGMIHPGKGSNTVRAVFIVDPDGKIRLILYYPQEIGRSVDEVLRAVKALQTSDANGVATPHNWPDNELFGDDVIVPPASDRKTAQARLKDPKIQCLDWWLCHKKL
ncbi:MAG: peroxiredoxin [Promethearchaeota archaeon]